MDFDILSWFGNVVNFTIFLYLMVGVLKTDCFDVSRLFISLFGIVVSIVIQVVSVYYRRVAWN